MVFFLFGVGDFVFAVVEREEEFGAVALVGGEEVWGRGYGCFFFWIGFFRKRISL